ncbi:unnamed protein product [Linum trigynum]|uniref:Uncharacterized protein n=1 Tax=Linum trigynum TaxID=586398 RepID=A0AAV2FD78_9ROSI
MRQRWRKGQTTMAERLRRQSKGSSKVGAESEFRRLDEMVAAERSRRQRLRFSLQIFKKKPSCRLLRPRMRR